MCLLDKTWQFAAKWDKKNNYIIHCRTKFDFVWYKNIKVWMSLSYPDPFSVYMILVYLCFTI